MWVADEKLIINKLGPYSAANMFGQEILRFILADTLALWE